MLDNLLANLTYYVDRTATFNTNYKNKKMMMQDYINCNKNVEIESNLWDTYDVLSDQCICIAQMYKDLKMKMDIIMNEKKRCEERGKILVRLISEKWYIKDNRDVFRTLSNNYVVFFRKQLMDYNFFLILTSFSR